MPVHLKIVCCGFVFSLLFAGCSLRASPVKNSESSFGPRVLDENEQRIGCNADADCELPGLKKVCVNDDPTDSFPCEGRIPKPWLCRLRYPDGAKICERTSESRTEKGSTVSDVSRVVVTGKTGIFLVYGARQYEFLDEVDFAEGVTLVSQ